MSGSRSDEGLGISADSSSANSGAEISGEEHERTSSDEQGNYRFDGVPAGLSRTVRARRPGYVLAERQILVRGAEPERLDFELDRGMPIEVEVFDRDTGLPLAGADVHDPWKNEPWTRTNASGRFTTWVARDHPFALDISREGYWPLVWSWTPAIVEPVPTARLPMARLVWIEGRIADPEGEPIQKAWQYIEYEGHTRLPSPTRETLSTWGTPGTIEYDRHRLVREELADVDGRYRLPVLACEVPLTLQIGAGGFVTIQSGPFVVTAPAGDRVLDFVLQRAAKIHGRTVRDGKPLHGRVVRRSLDGSSTGGAWADGDYVMEDVPAGTWELVLRDEEGVELSPSTLTVEAGREYEHDFVLGDEASLGTIAGRVIWPSPSPTGRLYVRAQPKDDPRADGDAASIDENGSFVLQVPRGRPYWVTAWWQDRWSRVSGDAIVVTPDAEGIELAAPTIGRLRLLLVDSLTRAPIALRSTMLTNALTWKRASDENTRAEHVEVDLEGGIDLALPVGECEISLDLAEQGFRPILPFRVTITGAPNDVRVVEVVRGIELRLQIVGPTGPDTTPANGHVVFLVERGQLESISGPYPMPGSPANHSFGGSRGIQMRIDDPSLMSQFLADEAFFSEGALLRGLAPGRYSVKCYPDDFTFEPAEFELADTEGAEVRVRWNPR